MTSSGQSPSVDLATLLGAFEAELIEHMPAILWVVDEEGRLVRWNRRFEEVLGWSQESLAALPLPRLAVDEDRDSVSRYLEHVFETGESRLEVSLSDRFGGSIGYRFTGRVVEAEGRRFAIGVGIEPASRSSVQQGRVAKFNAAISKLGQKLSEASTPRSAGRVIADISRDLIGGDAFSVTLFSPETGGVLPVFAMDTVDGVVTEFAEAIPAGTPPNPLFEEVMNTGSKLILRDEGRFSETSIPFGDTRKRSKSLIFVPVRKGERGIGVISIQSYREEAYSERDVRTLEALASHCAGALERLRVEAALRIAEQRFAHAFEASPVAMFIGTYDEGRALAVNAAFERVFGFSAEEVLGKNGLELGFWGDPRDREEIYRTIREGRKVRDVQVRFQSKAGETCHVLVSAETIEVEGEPCLLFFNYDITQRVELEARLRQAQKLESIGQVTAGAAHDFNNLLTVIDGCSSLALEKKGLDPEGRDLLEQISDAARRAANLTRSLLAFSSRQKMVSREVSLNSIVRNLFRMLQQLVGPRIKIELECAESLPDVLIDPGMIEQVVVNLVVNARDAMEGGGEIRMETSLVEMTTTPPEVEPGRYVRLRVSDNGCGISPGNLPRLFEPFFTTKEIGKGNGLGLATAYGIVKQHKGWIDVRSRIDDGSEFLVYLPPCDKKTSSPSPATEPASAVPKGTELVLVVEDEPGVRAMICHILRFYGYKTVEADSGVSGLEVWKAHKEEIEAVVTDIVMPGGMDGKEMARRLLKSRKDLPLLYVSGYSPTVAGQDLPFQEGVNFLQKPFEASKLAQTLRNLLDRARAVTRK